MVGCCLAIGVEQYVNSAREGSCPEASAFARRFITVWSVVYKAITLRIQW